MVGECETKGVRLFWASEKGKVAQAPSVTHPRATSLSEGGFDSANKMGSLMGCANTKQTDPRPSPTRGEKPLASLNPGGASPSPTRGEKPLASLHYFTPASAILRGLAVTLALYLLMCYNEDEFM